MSNKAEDRISISASAERAVIFSFSLAASGWKRLGDVLHKVTSPLLLCLLYFAIVMPVALVCRLCGHDPLGLQRHKLASYWVNSTPVAPESFKQQF